MDTLSKLIDLYLTKRQLHLGDPEVLERIDRRIDTLTTMMIELHYD